MINSGIIKFITNQPVLLLKGGGVWWRNRYTPPWEAKCLQKFTGLVQGCKSTWSMNSLVNW